MLCNAVAGLFVFIFQAFQYIGEMCRYLLKQPVNDLDIRHQVKSLRIMIGQGLRSNIWQEFVDRFHIPSVLETYGSTEGNVGLANLNEKVGAIGFTSWFLCIFRPQYLIVVDPATGEPLRGANGLCIQAKQGGKNLRFFFWTEWIRTFVFVLTCG